MPHLQDQLDEITTQTRTLVQPERLAIGERAVEELFRAGSEDRILPIGASAPAFALPDFSGRIVRSSDLLALGPLIVNFFRGRWCPYCVTELEAWRDLYPALRERGALVVASHRKPSAKATSPPANTPSPSRSSPMRAAPSPSSTGLVWTAPDYLRRYYRGILLNIPFVNGDESWRLPLPATYVLSPTAKSFMQKPTPTSASAPNPKTYYEPCLLSPVPSSSPLRNFLRRTCVSPP